MAGSAQFVTFLLAEHWFGVPVSEVQEVIRCRELTRVPLAPVAVRGLMNLRGQIVAAIDLRCRLGLSERPPGQLPMHVVVRTRDGAFSLLVDEIGEVIEAEDQSFETPPETLRGIERQMIQGVHKLPGRLLLVLDTECAVSGPGISEDVKE